MKFLSSLLRNPARTRSKPSGAGPVEQISRALDAAGVQLEGQSAVRATIDRALADAGLIGARPTRTSVQARRTGPGAGVATPGSIPPVAGGQFLHASHSNAAGRREYRLYLPVDYKASGARRPLVLMLHGCTQSAEDFALGTRMNALADRHGFLVAYPQQVANANHAKCWNWFRAEDQAAHAGEPSILAGIVADIARAHPVDSTRVFAAGLSAGAAMAVILGRAYPDLVRAIGVHSGLPYASAHDVPSAFAAMQGRGQAGAPGDVVVPMIVFHGDRDHTVAHANADALAGAVRPGLRSVVETGRAAGGQDYTRELAVDTAGRPWMERWTLHGAGHAWSGGDAAGSYTDPSGPDASAAMVDFFLRQPS